MSKPKHTPGPWAVESKIVGNPSGLEGTQVVTKDYNYLVAQCPTDPVNGMHVSVAKAEANARLIAAAPELLEALRIAQAKLLLLNALQTAHECGEVIRKATGGAE